MMNAALPAWFIFSRPESRDRWWVEAAEPTPGGDGWRPVSLVGDGATIEEARALIPDQAMRTLVWSTDDSGRCTREIWQ